MSMQRLTELAQEQLAAEREVERAEAALQEAKEALRRIQEQDLPSLMDEMEVSDFRTTTGLRVEVVSKVHCSITEANREQAMRWLREHEAGKLIKTQVNVFVKGDDKARVLARQLMDLGYSEVAAKSDVHHSTLRKYVGDQLKGGTADDEFQKLFGVHVRRLSQIDDAD